MERSEWVRQRRQTMARSALEVFSAKGIDAASLDEVAARAGVGIASVYRHFKTKADLAVAAAEVLWSDELATLGPSPDEVEIEGLLAHFLASWDAHPSAFRFLEDFDRYVVREGLDPGRLASYDRVLLAFRDLFKAALARGQRAGTVRGDLDADLFATTLSQGFFSLAGKLAARPLVVPSDRGVSGRAELALLVTWALDWLRPRGS